MIYILAWNIIVCWYKNVIIIIF